MKLKPVNSTVRSAWNPARRLALSGRFGCAILLATSLGLSAPAASQASGTGSISGTVIDATTLDPIENAEVCAYRASDLEYEGCEYTDSSGHYTIAGLGTGAYKVGFEPPYETDYASQFYDGKSSAEEADDVSVTSGSNTPGIDAQLEEGGEITGMVTDAGTSAHIEGIEACAYRGGSGDVGCATTDVNGEYAISGLPTGTYRVRFHSADYAELNYIPQYYDGKSSPEEATGISVSAGSTTSGIDAQMQEGGEITGMVADEASENPIAEVEACATLVSGEGEATECASTDSSGHFTIMGLPTGSYKVKFNRPFGTTYADQYYSGKATFAEATPVSVTAGSTTQNIDAALQAGGRITGTVTDATTENPIQSVDVCIDGGPEGSFYECESTDGSGDYEVDSLAAGTYHVTFYPGHTCSGGSCAPQNYVSQSYDEKNSQGEATPISVSVGSTTSGIDAQMQEGGHLSGTVIDDTTDQPVEGIEVCAFEPGTGESNFHRCESTDEHGEYAVNGVPTGYVVVRFSPEESFDNELNYSPQYYDDKGSRAEATHVWVTAGLTTSGIDAQMHAGGTISGTVTSASSHSPLAGIEACASEIGLEEGQEEEEACAATDSSGQYALVGLGSGSYKVSFSSYESEYALQYYDAKPSLHQADAIAVTAESTTANVDAEMQQGGRISGTVTAADTNSGLQGVEVCAVGLGSEEDVATCSLTGAAGHYAITQVTAGSYKVRFTAASLSGYLGQYYSGKATWAEGAAVAVTGGATAAGIDAQLSVPIAKPVNASPPKLVGSPEVGDVLSCGNGGWENSPTSFSYAWLQEGETIDGATGDTYTVEAQDAGHGISCKVTAGNALGSASATSNTLQIPAVTNPPLNAVAPVLHGTPAFGQLLSCGKGIWKNSPTSFSYVWLRDGAPIGGQSANTYTVGVLDAGRGISCEVTAGNALGSASATSNTLQIPPKPVNTAAPELSGSPEVGQQLFCGKGSWKNSPTSFSYAWLRDGARIGGQSANTYTVGVLDAGRGISCEVTASNSGGPTSAVSNILEVPAPADGGGTPKAPQPPPPPPVTTPKPKPLTCKKGFHKRKIRGKARCVKVKHRKRHRKG